jgi:hypothetical protein
MKQEITDIIEKAQAEIPALWFLTPIAQKEHPLISFTNIQQQFLKRKVRAYPLLDSRFTHKGLRRGDSACARPCSILLVVRFFQRPLNEESSCCHQPG